jgi:hypothetical protein
MPVSDPFHRYPPALRIVCPSCGAGPAQPCRSRRKMTTAPHPSRVERAAGIPRHDERRRG